MTQPDPKSHSRRSMSLRAMLASFSVAAVVALVTLGALSLWGARESTRTATQTFVAKDVTADILPPPLYLIEMRLVLSQAVEGSLSTASAAGEFARLRDEYTARIRYWQENPPFGLEGKLLGAQHTAGLAFIDTAGKVLSALDVAAGKGPSERVAVDAALRKAQAAYLAHRTGVDDTVQASNAFAQASMTQFESMHGSMFWAQVALLTIGALGLSGLSFWISRAIWRAVGGEPAAAAAVARAVADGELSSQVPVALGDKHSVMAALEEMRRSLGGIVGQVRTCGDSIATASAQIAGGNNDLSGRTEQQASALEQTAASMEELSATVKLNADNARQANQLAQGASTVALRGGDVVGQVVKTMQDIDTSSKKITDIISVIDGIAFQTNILALNAAVEAARAGEQGRGFAVVASEVRSLAQRSAEAAKEIKTLISASVDRVQLGTALVDQAGVTMQEVVSSIRRVTDIMGEISAASTEQSQGVAQVGEAVTQMDQATQQNAALVEESAAAAESLKMQAQQLVDAVAVFKIAKAACAA